MTDTPPGDNSQQETVAQATGTRPGTPIIALVVLCVIAGASGAWWYVAQRPTTQFKETPQAPTSSTPQSREGDPVVPAAQIELDRVETLRRAVITFPDIISTTVHSGAVSNELYPLVEHEQEVSVSDVQYGDGSTGYRIEFVLLGTVNDAVKRFGFQLRRLGWDILTGGYGAVFGFVDAERGIQRVRVSYTSRDATTTTILIQSMELKEKSSQ